MRLLSLLAAATLVIPWFATAGGCEGTTSPAEVAAGGFYVDFNNCLGVDCLTTVWIYEESNEIAGLQRADEVVDDTCGGAAGPGDTIIF